MIERGDIGALHLMWCREFRGPMRPGWRSTEALTGGTILEKNVRIPENARIGYELAKDHKEHHVTETGIVIVEGSRSKVEAVESSRRRSPSSPRALTTIPPRV